MSPARESGRGIRLLVSWRAFGRDVQLILLSVGLMGLAFFGMFNTLFNLYLLRLGHDAAFVGGVASLSCLAQAALSVPASMLGRRIGGKQVMILGLTTMILGMAGVAISEYVPVHWQRIWLIASRVLASGSMSVYFPNMAPALMTLSRPERQDKAFSAQWSALMAGTLAGSLLGGWLPVQFARALNTTVQHTAPYRYTLLLAATTLTFGVWALAKMRATLLPEHTESSTGSDSLAASASPPYAEILVYAVVNLFWHAGMSGISGFFNVYLDASLRVELTAIGAVIAAAQLASAGASLATPAVVSRLGRWKAILSAKTLAAVSLLPLALVARVSAASIGYLSFCALGALVGPMSMMYGQLLVSPRWRGLISGARGTSGGLGSAAASLLGALVITVYGYNAFFLVCTAFVAASAVTFAWRYRVPRGELAAR